MSILGICDIFAICLVYLWNAINKLKPKGLENLSSEMTRKGKKLGRGKRAWPSRDSKGREEAESLAPAVKEGPRGVCL